MNSLEYCAHSLVLPPAGIRFANPLKVEPEIPPGRHSNIIFRPSATHLSSDFHAAVNLLVTHKLLPQLSKPQSLITPLTRYNVTAIRCHLPLSSSQQEKQ
ncbi:hypothetical protein D9756_006329 [Leucocoprinus leucothites]|uniref:Uncharacterized protein n=1 Tax=Leucocoprinus leucothites TaxID=201217 RepID=A0A8H5D445_9AGAR|nr:hypothetical protein D9756_006329 [Leucoagaricus leucothites]